MTNALMLILAASLPSSAGMNDQSPFDQALSDQSAWVVRAQSPEPNTISTGFTSQTQTLNTAYSSAPIIPVQTYAPQGGYPQGGYAPMQDPFASGAIGPYATQAPGGYYMRGINGPQPARYGWQDRIDFTFIPKADADRPATGGLEVFGIDIEKLYTMPLANSWTFAIGPQFSYRSWQGPQDGITPTTDLPGGVYRLGLDMVLRTPTVNGWTLEGGFDPSLATDFKGSVDSDAVLFDGHLVAFWQLNPKWTLALGALYWDRVDDIVLPYAGAIWTPNDIWEFRLVFPKPRISAFLGTPMGVPTWAYVGAEYHVEAYQIQPDNFTDTTRVQMADWRILGGLKWESGWLTSFLEAGYIFDRKVQYKSIGSNFDVDSGFIGRVGFRY